MRNKRKFIFISLLFLSIGFAAVTTTLVLNGTLTIAANSKDFEKNVVFTKAETDSDGKAGISLDGKAITFKSKELKGIQETSELDFDVTNKSRQYGVDATIECTKSDEDNPFNEYIDLSIEPSEFTLDKGETQNGKLVVKMVKSFVGTDDANTADIEIKCTINASAKETDMDENESYIPDTSNNKKVTGYLVDENNNPLANKTIVITSGDKTYYVTTDKDGHYEVEVAPGNYDIYIVDGKTQEELNKMTKEELEKISSNKGELTTNDKNISFESGVKAEEKKTISGYLVDENNNPVANKTIVITSGDKTYYVTTDKDGYYEIEGIIPGNYDVYIIEDKTIDEVKKLPINEIKEEASSKGTYSTADNKVSFESGVKSEEKKSISGYLVDENNNPIANQTIVITSGNKTYYVTTDENGYYELKDIVPGNYEIYVVEGKTPDEVKDMSKDDIKNESSINGSYSTNEENISFKTGAKVEEKKSISGYLVDKNNNPIANQTIVITSGNKTYYVTTDENGYYELKDIVPGNYEIYVVEGKTPDEIKDMSIEEVKDESSIKGSYSTTNDKPTFNEGVKTTTSEPKTITFDTSSLGTTIPSINVIEGEPYGELPKVSKEGYNFEGWYLGDELILPSTIVNIKEGQTLTPKFSVMKFIITFNATGGTTNQVSKEVTYGENYGDLPTASNTGYNFVGWYTDTEYTTQITKTTKVTITTNQTLYAKWEAKSFKVNFNSDGGNSISTKIVKYNSNYGKLEEPKKDGYNFIGWYLGENLITESTKFISLSDVTLTAKWEVKKTTIIVEVNGTPTEVEIELNKPTIETLPEVEKEGYEFEGWYKDSSGNEKLGEDEIIPDDGSVKLYPIYKAKKYTVTFNGNTGSVSQSTKEVTFDAKYGDLPTPTKAGYNFTGWFTDQTNGTQVTKDTIVKLTSNQTLYAHWSAKTDITYTVKHWQQNIGSNAESKDSTNYTLVNTESLKGTTNASVSPNTKTYTGFTSPNKTSVTVKADGSAEVNYYYTRNSYTLTVNKDSGVSTVNSKTSYQYGESVNIGYTIKSGYTFKDITGNQTTNAFTMPASNVTININTTENTYTITYNLNGGSATNPTSYKVTSNNITLTNPTRTGYTFAGWTGSNGTTKQTSVTLSKGSTGNKTYTANWNANTYSVSFDANGGNTVSSVLTVTYDGTYGSTLPTPTRAGYTFTGWFTSASGGTQVTSTTKVSITANQTLYAQWTIKSYSVTINKNTGGSISSTSLSLNYGGTKTFTITPSTGYYLSGVSCTNGYTTNAKTGTSQTAAQTVTVSNNSKDATSVCTVAFTQKQTLIAYITNLAKSDTTNLAYDGTTDNNLRYIGASPNNYVSFNGELWRIIGVMNNVPDSNGTKASRVKIIKDSSYGNIAFNTSIDSDWSKATLQTTLNGSYLSSLTTNTKNMISNITWNLGGASTGADSLSLYNQEKGTAVYSESPTTWKGYVGLMYPSDYGFAVGGNSRDACLTTTTASYHSCYVDDWLYLSSSQWTLTPYTGDRAVFYIHSNGRVGNSGYPNMTYAVRPVVYLNTNITILSGSGTSSSPYIIG